MTWQQAEAKRARWDKKFKGKMSKFFMDQGKKIGGLEKNGEFEKNVLSIINGDVSKLKYIYIQLYSDIIRDFGQTVYNELINKKMFSIFAFGVYSWIASIALARAKKVSGYSRLVVLNIVKRANEEGWNINTTAKVIRLLFINSFSKKRAIKIARTEVNTASNYGSFAGAKQTGLELKKFWIDTNDSRTRPTHRKAGRMPPIKMDEKFKVGKGRLSYPGDPSGPAEEVIQCRCTIGYRRVKKNGV